MKKSVLFVIAVSLSAPAFAQHVHMDHAQAAPPAAQPPAAPGQGRQAGPPPIDVPWDDSIPAGTMDHAARAVAGIVDVRITAKLDQLLVPLPEGASYLGFIFARAPAAREAEEAVRQAHRCLSFAIDPAIAVTRV